MRPVYRITGLAIACLACAPAANADMIDLQYWADEVVHHTSNIQNYSGEIMDTAKQWWVLGASDADTNDNGYAWDDVDRDYVAGWRANAPGESIVVKFNAGLPDRRGNDLVIRMYCGSSANASVSASMDGNSYTQIGSIVGGQPGMFRDAEFDFGGLPADDVHYVKVERVTNGAETGMFFDSFASTPAPEPTAFGLLVSGGAVTAGGWVATRRRTPRRPRRW